MRYQLERVGTELTIGWFACLPCEDLDFENALEYIRDHPYDDFMHKYLLDMTGTFGPKLAEMLIERGKEEDVRLLALMYEGFIINNRFRDLKKSFDGIDIKHLAQYTPLIYINWFLGKNQKDNPYWIGLFSDNIYAHKPLPAPDRLEHPLPFDKDVIEGWKSGVVRIEDLVIERGKGGGVPKVSPEETSKKAIERLGDCELEVGPEEPMQAILSPHALLRQWKLDVSVSTGRNQWQLTGIQTSYGKGLDIHEARASCLMEVVERCSSFASFDSNGIAGYKNSYTLTRANHNDLIRKGHSVLDPNDMNLEVQYQNQDLYWLLGEMADDKGHCPIYVPAQLVFLFCNLDEVGLTSGLPSSGLASGNSLEEARLRALSEVIERDAERVVPYVRERCFLLESDDPVVGDILQDCREKGIEVQFLDITSEFGIPCYKAFIQGKDGEIFKGTGAGLDGKKAAVSALTEVPYSNPSGDGLMPAPEGIRKVRYEDLPDYSSGDASEDLRLLERLLSKNGYSPIYVDLTRSDLDIPVAKCLVPGLEMISDFDRFSFLSLRQFAHLGY